MPARPTNPTDDEKLLERLRAGDDAAYEELVRTHGGRLLAVARRFLRSEEDARDAVQDAFTSVFRSIGAFEGQARLSTWLHRIVVNASLMRLRRARRKPEESIDALLPGFLENGMMERPASPWRREGLDPSERAELRKLVLDGIGRLPEGYRNVLMLRDVEDLDTEETAQILEISPGAVKTRLHRARQALREMLEPELREASGE